MQIRVLGPLEVLRDGRRVVVGGRRQRSALAGLIATSSEGISTDGLIDVVWAGAEPPSARRSLQTYVSRLRTVLGEDRIERMADGYRLRLDEDELDATRFEDLTREGHRRLDADAEAAWEMLDEALGLWRGEPLADVDADGTVATYAAHLSEQRLRCLEDRAAAGLTLGRHHELVAELRPLTEAHPLREGLRAQLMLALYRSGRQSEALEVAADLRRTLSDELGLDPSPAVRELEERILRHDPGLAAEPRPGRSATRSGASDDAEAGSGPERGSTPLRNPYKGLRAFGEGDADDFFGREAVVERVVERVIGGERLVAVVGPSGSGKSSLVLAGVVPGLRERGSPAPLVTRMTPGSHPFAQLEAALGRVAPRTPALDPADELSLLRAVLDLVPDEHTDLVIVIDQLEELLTGAIDRSEVTAFVTNLAEALEDPHGQLSAVATLRSDFVDRALALDGLSELIADGLVSVPPMSSADLRSAVVGPAEQVGLTVDPELVNELVEAVTRRPGSLPLLQFVLTELTDRATGGRLELAALRAAGGIDGTLARRAEAAYASLPSGARDAARALMLRLVAIDHRGEATRRIRPLEALDLDGVAPGLRDRALEAFVAERLLTTSRDDRTGGATVEVTHEAVFGAWPRCAGWIDDVRDELRAAARLEQAAEEWDANDRSPDYLLTGSRLTPYDDRGPPTEGISPLAATYLAASRERRDEIADAEEERTRRERDLELRSARRARAAAGILALLVVVAGVLSVVAIGQSRIAQRERAATQAASHVLLVRQLSSAAAAEVGRDAELGLLLALHAVRVAQINGVELPVETQEALHTALQGLRVPYPVADADIIRIVDARGPRGAYALPLADLVALATAQVDRELTTDECRRFLTGDACPALSLDLDALPPAETPDAGGEELLAGTTVEFTGLFAGTDGDSFRDELARFTDATGIEVVYTEASNLEALVLSGYLRRNGDVVSIPQPALLARIAREGDLVDLGRYLDPVAVRDDYGAALTSLASVGSDGLHPAPDGTLFGVPMTVNVKSLIWYSPRHFTAAGYEVPSTWGELLDLSRQMIADGRTPWCFALESEGASGWPGTDVVEDLLLQSHGTAVYDGWVRGDIAFSDPRVRSAFEQMGQLVFSDGWTFDGPTGALRMGWWEGVVPIRDDDPGCWLHHGAQFLANGWPVDEELAFFPIPPVDPEAAPLVLGAGDFNVAYTDRPEVRALMRHLAGPEFGARLLSRVDGASGQDVPTGWLLANRRFDPSHYPDPWRRDLAETVARSMGEDRFRFDGADLMPPAVGQAPFYGAMVRYVREGPDALDEILTELDEAMQTALEGPEATRDR